MNREDGVYSRAVIDYGILTCGPENFDLSVIDRAVDVSAGFLEAGNTAYKRIRVNGLESGVDALLIFAQGIFRGFWLRKNFFPTFKIDINAISTSLVLLDDNVAYDPYFQRF